MPVHAGARLLYSLNMREWFAGRTLTIATMHEKERVIAPLLSAALGVDCRVPPAFDTDRFGTFTRTVARAGTQVEAARAKARAALSETGGDLAIASEGSFGTHPAFPLVSRHLELVLLIDTQYGLEVAGWHEEPGTLYRGEYVESVDAALALAADWGFPEQGVVLRAYPERSRGIEKEIRTTDQLRERVTQRLRRPWCRRVYLETDLRAHRCPPRRERIAAATEDLLATLAHPCPHCTAPGFAVAEVLPGALCASCGGQTDAPRAMVRRCGRCAHEATGAVSAEVDPAQCPRCNP